MNRVNIFRTFYVSMLTASMVGEADLTEAEMAAFRASGDSGADLIIRRKVNVEGTLKEYVYRFYNYSEGRTYLTINGAGYYYVLHDMFLDKLIGDLGLLLSGETLDYENKLDAECNCRKPFIH